MPRLNGRGPNGEGPMTGRNMGRCNPDNKGLSEEEILKNSTSSSQKGMGLRRGAGAKNGLGKGLGQGRGNAGRFRGNG
ncbi:MAG: DUF5320 domain-containing protein [Bacteroidales bacterium]